MARITVEEAGGINVVSFLDAIGVSENGAKLLAHPMTDDGYKIIVGSTPTAPHVFNDYSRHPRVAVKTKYGWSDAAGRYQIMAAIAGKITTDTWDWAHRAAGVDDFSPESQDLTCIVLVKHRGALADVIAGNIASAFAKCAPEWASLPGAGYGQPENKLADLTAVFEAARAGYA
jgi:muramidase (phage lysozyme)